jgi:hypothetical protein
MNRIQKRKVNQYLIKNNNHNQINKKGKIRQ